MKYIIKRSKFKLVKTNADKDTLVCIKNVKGKFYNKVYFQVGSLKLIFVTLNKTK